MRNNARTNIDVLFFIAVAWGASIFWIAPHPPMVDLAQHAGQIALLKDWISGDSTWKSLFQINLLTPYLVGYGAGLLLSFFMPVVVAMKVLLSFAYVSSVLLWKSIGRSLNSDPSLDWLAIPSFFGFCYYWGLFTFLISTPICLAFLYYANQYSTKKAPQQGFVIGFAGFALLVAHGLSFALGWSIGVALLVMQHIKARISFRLYAPYLVLAVLAVLFYVAGKQLDKSIITVPVIPHFGDGPIIRFLQALRFPFFFGEGVISRAGFMLMIIAMFVAIILLRLRVDMSSPSSWVPFSVTAAIFWLMPATMDNTSLLYQRFSLYLLPTFAWMFSRLPAERRNAPPPSVAVSRFASALLVASTFIFLGLVSLSGWRFGQEAAGIEKVMEGLEPRQRALALVFDPTSPAAESADAYLHFPVWYQAERHGLTDYNFAWGTAQVVRYRPESRPAVGIGFDNDPETFSWDKHRGSDYGYFFVRGANKTDEALFRGAPCLPKLVTETGSWRVFRSGECAREGGTPISQK